MAPISKFKLLSKCNSLGDNNSLKLELPDFSVRNTNYSRCQLCKIKDHKMKVQYSICINASCNVGGLCNKRFLTKVCMKLNEDSLRKRWIYEESEHRSDKFVKQYRGISDNVKAIMEELISEFECRPLKIHLKLQKPKYKDLIDVMPTLEQVQTYVKNRRRTIGDDNNLESLSKYVNRLVYDDSKTQDDELFVFGVEMGTPFLIGECIMLMLRTKSSSTERNRINIK